MDEKYIITIDGPDCTGKSTLWRKANEYNKNIQIRGIVSNIAYAIKYGRNVNELIELYNQNPVNYVVYLLNPINDKKLEMLYNRIRDNYINDNDKITEELREAAHTWKDKKYFDEAIQLLTNKYDGKLEVIVKDNNNYDSFIEAINKYSIKSVDEVTEFAGIKKLNTAIDTFEKEAKELSEFKYIVLFNKLSKDEVIAKLYTELDDEHKNMYDTLMEYGSDGNSDIYDCLESLTVEGLTEFLDNYEFRCDVNIRCDVDTSMECIIPLKDFCDDNDRCLEDYIYNDSSLIDDVQECVFDEVRYGDIQLEVERVR